MKVECGGRVEAMISTLVEAILAMAMFNTEIASTAEVILAMAMFNTEMASTAEVILAMAMFDTVMVFVAMDKFLSLPSVVIVDQIDIEDPVAAQEKAYCFEDHMDTFKVAIRILLTQVLLVMGYAYDT